MEKVFLDRKILLSGNICNNSIKTTIDRIFEINYDDTLKQNEFANFKRQPIELYINSFGGSCYDGLALVDIIRTNENPINTYCFGSCMSMGFWIFMAGKKRLAGKNSTFMYHEVSGWVWDKLEGMKQEVKECERLQVLYDSIITSQTLVAQETLNDYRLRKAEWFIAPEEAKNLNICHEIL